MLESTEKNVNGSELDPDEALQRLRCIRGMFNEIKAEPTPELSKAEKLDPSDKLLEKLNKYEQSSEEVDKEELEQRRKAYLEGVPFQSLHNTVDRFLDSANYDDSSATVTMTDSEWESSLTSSRIDDIFQKAVSYCKLDSEQNKEMLTSFKQAIKDAFLTKDSKDGIDKKVEWFSGLTDNRIEQFFEKAVPLYKGKTPLDTKFVASMIIALKNQISDDKKSAKKLKYKTEIGITVPKGLTRSRAEEILKETAKEYVKNVTGIDVDIVKGLAEILKSQIKSSMEENEKPPTTQTEHISETPGLTAARIDQLLKELSKEYEGEKHLNIDVMEGLAKTLKEKFVDEMNKEVKAEKTVEIEVIPGLANAVKDKIVESIKESSTVKKPFREIDVHELPKERIISFSQQAQDAPVREWKPDVDLQAGLAKERASKYTSEMSADSSAESKEWIPDVPVESGLAKERVAQFVGEEKPAITREWVPDVPLESGLAKERVALFTKEKTPETTKEWAPDVVLEPGLAKQRVENIYKEKETEQREWRPDVELQSGIAKERVAEYLKGEEVQSKEWTPDVDLKSGMAKERAILFQNLETRQTSATAPASPKPLVTTSDGKQMVVEVENEPLPPDPNVARETSEGEQITVEAGHAKLMLEKLKSAYEEDAKPVKAERIDDSFVKPEEGHAKNLKMKFVDYEQSAKKVHTTAEKSSYIPRRFVDTPAPVPKVSDPVTEEKCSVCKQPMSSTEGLKISNGYVHKKCFVCSVCSTSLRLDSYTTAENRIYCKDHIPK